MQPITLTEITTSATKEPKIKTISFINQKLTLKKNAQKK